MTAAFAPIISFGQVMAGFPPPGSSPGAGPSTSSSTASRATTTTWRPASSDATKALARHLAGWRLAKAVDGPQGAEWVPWAVGERLVPPIFQVRAWPPAGAVPGAPEYEFFLNDAADGSWHFRRDPAITYPLASLVRRSARDLPIIAPEV